jgi:hypothetical protein
VWQGGDREAIDDPLREGRTFHRQHGATLGGQIHDRAARIPPGLAARLAVAPLHELRPACLDGRGVLRSPLGAGHVADRLAVGPVVAIGVRGEADGVTFGVIMAAYYRQASAKHGLPPWDRYPEG